MNCIWQHGVRKVANLIISPTALSGKKAEDIEERKIAKPNRLTFPMPYCTICKEEVDHFEVEYDDIKELVRLHVKCHGREWTKEIPNYSIGQYETRMMFNDPRLLTLRGRRVLQPWEKSK